MSERADLDGIEARANAATPGPWHGEHDEFGCVHMGDYGWVAGGHDPDCHPHYDEDSEQGKADAEFIAHAREDVPALVAEVRALRAKVADAETLAGTWMRNQERSAEYQDGLADAAEQLGACMADVDERVS